MRHQLRMTQQNWARLNKHLFGDNKHEGLAFAIAGRRFTTHAKTWMVQELWCVDPDDPEYIQSTGPDHITYRLDVVAKQLAQRQRPDTTLLKFHSHPGGFAYFSDADDHADGALAHTLKYLFPQWHTDAISIVLAPHHQCAARFLANKSTIPLCIDASCDTHFGLAVSQSQDRINTFANQSVHARTAEAFGDRSREALKSMRVGVVGVSGTGSHVAESLARLGVGELVLVDGDRLEPTNLSRVMYARKKDIGALKVDVAQAYITALGLGTDVWTVPKMLYNANAIELLASSDILFGCVDSLEAREVLSRLSSYDLIPYIDLGVGMVADGTRGLSQATASVHVIGPGSAGLCQRGLYTSKALGDEMTRRYSPEQAIDLEQEGYLKTIPSKAPAVVSLNGVAAGLAVNELLARLFVDRFVSYNHLYHCLTLGTMSTQNYDTKKPLATAGLGQVTPDLGLYGM